MTVTLEKSAVQNTGPSSPTTGSRAAVSPLSPPRWAVVAGRVCLVVAVVGAWCLLYLFGLSRLEESHAQHGLYTRLRSELAAGTAPVKEPIASGAPIGTIAVPVLGIRDLVFVQGTTSGDLQDGPGHLAGTPLPGQAGVDVGSPPAAASTGSIFDPTATTAQNLLGSVIYGRGTTFGAPFADIDELHRGDAIKVVTGEGTFVYAVLDVRGKGDPEPVQPSGTRSLLTLVTASGSGALGWLTPNHAVYVDAVEQQAGLPSTALAVPRSGDEQVLAGGLSLVTELELALSAIALIVVIAALWWSRGRWGAAKRWIAGAPALVAALWLVTDVSVQLLPNVF